MAASPDSALTEIVIAALSAGGISAIVAAIVTGLFSKKKLGAEATEIITKAASGVVSDLRQELDRARETRLEEAKEHREEIIEMAQAHVKERAEWQRVLQLHVAWDALAIAKLAELGVKDLPEAPPLLPARRFVDDEGYPVDRG